MGHTTVAGKRAVKEILQNSPQKVETVYIQEGRKRETAFILNLCRKYGIKYQVVPPAKLDDLTEHKHNGVVAKSFAPGFLDEKSIVDQLYRRPIPMLLALDHLQDQGNVGALARTGSALGIAGMVLTKDRSASLGSRAMKSSAGALERLPVARVTNMARFLEQIKEKGGTAYYAGQDEGSVNIFSLQLCWPAIVVLGNEEKGVRPGVAKRCDQGLHIPMPGGLDSLNVAQAGAMIMAEMLRQWLSASRIAGQR